MTALQSAWTAAAKRAFQAELLHDAISAKRAWLEAWRLAEHGLHDDALAAYAFFQALGSVIPPPGPSGRSPDMYPAWCVVGFECVWRMMVTLLEWLTWVLGVRLRARLGPGHQ